jgi:ABC-2 type transport system ATP-binding protein
MTPAPLLARDLSKTFMRKTGERITALDRVSLAVGAATLTALVGPDSAGKTTLIRLAAGLLTPDGGTLAVLGLDAAGQPQAIQERIGYMPQRFGLYEDLSVQENLDLYADLHGIGAAERTRRYPELLDMTALGPFRGRLAGKLSGGMKQKLGLACTLVRSPELLLLDEPTVGVDPLSRRELWTIVLGLVRSEGLTVLMSTSYLDEAERCDHVVVMHEGRALADGNPREVTARAEGRTFVATPARGDKARTLQARLLAAPGIVDAVPAAGRVRFVTAERGSMSRAAAAILGGAAVDPAEARFESGFMTLLQKPHAEDRSETSPPAIGAAMAPPAQPAGADAESARPRDASPGAVAPAARPGAAKAVVEVRELVRKFGAFTAVDHVSFEVRRGEVFGLLGPNGAGKTTTFRMLCGLLPATSGTLRVAGADLRTSRASARERIGYVAQKFSLYGPLSIRENLAFFARAYGLRGGRASERIGWAMQEFDLERFASLPSAQLPGGFKQRLAMAAALLHGPDILFLDEPTSGADPIARREFWARITFLAEAGVTVVVTTHFMEEAEYCDRILILDAGRVRAAGTPAEIRARGTAEGGREPDMEDAFIAIVEAARAGERGGAENAA